MIHALHRPRPPLDRLVDFFWVRDVYDAQTPRERVLPSSAPTLVVRLGDHPVEIFADERAPEASHVSNAVVCGPRTRPLVVGTSLGLTVGVHFKPGVTRLFFEVPAHELAVQAASLEALWGPSARLLRERLAEAAPLERVQILEDFLLARARRSFELSPLLRESIRAFEEPDLSSVAEVNRRTGLSPKRLLALFRDEIGLSPKEFWRVRRFRAALRDFERGTMRGAALASEHGYFDQAHYLREFRALAGSNPREYLATRVAGTDHAALSDKVLRA